MSPGRQKILNFCTYKLDLNPPWHLIVNKFVVYTVVTANAIIVCCEVVFLVIVQYELQVTQAGPRTEAHDTFELTSHLLQPCLKHFYERFTFSVNAIAISDI
jgi:hypothetical protein